MPAKTERTLILLKPDAYRRSLLGTILSRFESKGFRIIAMKSMRMSKELAGDHYAVHQDKPFYGELVSFMTSGPIVAAVLEAPDAIAVCRKILGPTFGPDAPAGTIRGDYSISRQTNLVHASDGEETAKEEISRFFQADEILDFGPWPEDE